MDLKSRLLTRRRLLASAIAATAGAAVAGVALRSRGRGPAPASPAPAVTPALTTPAPERGGIAHFASPVSFTFDTFDALRSADASVIEVLGRTHSRLLNWADFEAPRLAGDLAAAWEQPDPSTLVLTLNPAARWQDRPPAAGRPVTAADIVVHLERARALAVAGKLAADQRPAGYAAIKRVSTPAPDRVVIEGYGPQPFLLSQLASRWALVQAPEVVAMLSGRTGDPVAADAVGSGSFLLDLIAPDGALTFTANRGGHRPPLLDGLTVTPPGDEVLRFSGKRLDETIAHDRRDAAALRALRGPVESSRLELSPIVSTLFVGAPPWNNPELIRAFSGALNRRTLADRLTGGRAVAAGPVLPLHPAFALSETALAAYPGYAVDPADDLRDARARWAAAGGPGLGPVTIEFPSIFDPLFGASGVVPSMLNEAFGTTQFRPAVDSYTAIAAKVAGQRYGNGSAATWFGWGPPASDPDPSAFLIDTFRGGSTPFGYRSAATDSLLDRLAHEMELDSRQAICREVARQILEDAGGGIVTWLVRRSEVFRWPYLNAPPATAFWAHHLDDRAWLARSAPLFERRAD